MKRYVVLMICCILLIGLLSGCGSTDSSGQNPSQVQEQNAANDSSVENEQSFNDEESTIEENNQGVEFDGKVMTVNMDDEDYYMKYVLTITDYKVINPGEEGNEYGESPVIAFWYETEFEAWIEEMTANLSWCWVLNAIQDNNESAINELEMTSSPDSELSEIEDERIKDGATVKGAVAYKLDDITTPVQIVGEMNGQEVGRGIFEISS